MNGDQRPGRVEVAIVGLAFAAVGLVTAALLFTDDRTFMSLDAPPGATLHLPAGDWTVDGPTLRAIHRTTVGYVLGERPQLPEGPGRLPLYDADERAHLADVRAVFIGARLAQGTALLLLAYRVTQWRRSGGRAVALLFRDGVAVALVITAVLAVGAAVAFEPLFLLFHRIFFPQGNFLFDPQTSNLLAVYPEQYWEGVTLRIGIAFLGIGGVVVAVSAAVAHLKSPR